MIKTEINKLTSMNFITSKQLIWTVIGLFAVIQAVFLVVRPSDEVQWQILGWVLSTNIAAVFLAIIGNIEVEKARNLSQKIYTAEMIETIGLFTSLKLALDEASDEDYEDELKEVAPYLLKILRRYTTQKAKLEKVANIKKDEVFMSAMEEVIN